MENTFTHFILVRDVPRLMKNYLIAERLQHKLKLELGIKFSGGDVVSPGREEEGIKRPTRVFGKVDR